VLSGINAASREYAPSRKSWLLFDTQIHAFALLSALVQSGCCDLSITMDHHHSPQERRSPWSSARA